jgi:hypothetical protein
MSCLLLLPRRPFLQQGSKCYSLLSNSIPYILIPSNKERLYLESYSLKQIGFI